MLLSVSSEAHTITVSVKRSTHHYCQCQEKYTPLLSVSREAHTVTVSEMHMRVPWRWTWLLHVVVDEADSFLKSIKLPQHLLAEDRPKPRLGSIVHLAIKWGDTGHHLCLTFSVLETRVILEVILHLVSILQLLQNMSARGRVSILLVVCGIAGLCCAGYNLHRGGWNSETWHWNSEMWHQNSETWHWNSEMWHQNSEMWHWNSETGHSHNDCFYAHTCWLWLWNST